MLKKIFITFLSLIIGLFLFGLGLLSIAILIAYPKLPNLNAITQYKPKTPLKIYSSDGQLIGIYGEEHRTFTPINQFPTVLKDAVIAAEDKRFYEHWGVDMIGVIRAAISNIRSGHIQSGASTITQQVARNFFLTNKQTFTRKFNEALLAYKIEQSLTKNQILELYFNQIYLGQRSYGFAAASYAYFNKPVNQIDLAEAAMLAGLPKGPSAFNPFVNPTRAKARQLYILKNMLSLKMITPTQYKKAVAEKLHYHHRQINVDENALYVAEMARQAMYKRYGDSAYTSGFQVYTTVFSKNQEVATQALRQTLSNYSNNGQYAGAEAYINLSNIKPDELNENIIEYLSSFHVVNNLVPAIVTSATNHSIDVIIQGVDTPIRFEGNAIRLIKKALFNTSMGNKQIRPGAVIRVAKDKKGQWYITQEPELQGALVSIDADTGAIRALVGGYDFYQKEFNRATQAWRQPGSTIKPFVYSAAIDKGMTTATMINDAPISLPGLGPGGSVWNPKNSGNRYAGFITLHQALVASKNMVSIRILMAIGTDYARDYMQHFGISPNTQPNSLSLTLGTGSVTPIQMATAYAVFANGGYKIVPYLIDKIYDDTGHLLAETHPLIAGKNAHLVIDPRNAFIMYKMMQDVARYGTAARASALHRKDIAGKTGTTNEQKDAWFVGYNPKIVTAVYVGYDKPRTLGRLGFGGRIALPVWMDYMQYALKNVPQINRRMPAGVVQNGNDYFYREWQSTNPNLVIDNRSSEDVLPDEMDFNNPDLENGQSSFTPNFGTPNTPQNVPQNIQPLQPIAPAPQQRYTPPSHQGNGQLNNLF